MRAGVRVCVHVCEIEKDNKLDGDLGGIEFYCSRV